MQNRRRGELALEVVMSATIRSSASAISSSMSKERRAGIRTCCHLFAPGAPSPHPERSQSERRVPDHWRSSLASAELTPLTQGDIAEVEIGVQLLVTILAVESLHALPATYFVIRATSRGETPYLRRNMVLKCAELLNPWSNAMEVIDRPSPFAILS